MTDIVNAESAVGRDSLNPVDQVIPTLERLGITEDGRYDFDATAISTTFDVVSLGREGETVVLAAYLKPQAHHPQPEYQRVRSHVFYRLPAAEPVYVKSDVLRCQGGGNHPLDQTYVDESEMDPTEVGHFEALKHLISSLASQIHPLHQIALAESAERLKQGCSGCPVI